MSSELQGNDGEQRDVIGGPAVCLCHPRQGQGHVPPTEALALAPTPLPASLLSRSRHPPTQGSLLSSLPHPSSCNRSTFLPAPAAPLKAFGGQGEHPLPFPPFLPLGLHGDGWKPGFHSACFSCVPAHNPAHSPRVPGHAHACWLWYTSRFISLSFVSV